MKKARKVLSLILALVMVLALAVTANAAGEGTPGTITITNASKGETYTAYQLFAAQVQADVDNNAGITYTGTVPAGLGDYFEASNNTIVAKTMPTGYEGGAAAFEAARTAALKSWADDQAGKATTDSDYAYRQSAPGTGAALVLNVPYGYYVITSTSGTGAAITVDSTNPSVSVVDKNTNTPTFPANNGGKTVDDNLVELGETTTYTITLNTVNWAGEGAAAKKVVSYTITDDFGKGEGTTAKLTNIENVTIKVGDTDITSTIGTTDITEFVENGEITIPWTAANGNSLYDNDAPLTITYTATVAATGTITNKVSATYKVDGEDDDKEIPTDPTVDVYNAQVVVTKVDSSNENAPLAGAGFVVKKVVTDPITQAKTTLYYQKNDNGNDIEWVQNIANATEHVTEVNNNMAQVTFDGLAEGTYILEEKTVPAGYNKAADQEFTIKNSTDADWAETDLTVGAIVENSTGTELPATGGIGTTIFTVVGGVLMVGAAILFITKKRSEDING